MPRTPKKPTTDVTPPKKRTPAQRRKTDDAYALREKIARHPDRRVIEHLLRHWSAAKVELHLLHRYPPRNDLTGELCPDNAKLRVGRATLTAYRRKYLEPVWAKSDDEPWIEPWESSPLEGVLPPRQPSHAELFELGALALAIEAAEMTLARCLIIDGRSGIVSDITINTLKALADICETRAILAARLGVPGYDLVPEKLQFDSRSLIMHGEVERKPLEPEKIAFARALMEIEPKRRAILMAAPLHEVDPHELIDSVIDLDEAPTKG